jgi:hypothetical protein
MMLLVYNFFVLENMLLEIKTAEDDAIRIITDAKMKAAKITEDTNIEIEKINTKTADEVARLSICPSRTQTPDIPVPNIEVPKAKYDEAIKYITQEFKRRYM